MATVCRDRGWSWVIAAACCWVTFVIQGLVRSSGVVYVALIDAYGITRAQASWPFTLRMAIWNLSGPVAGALSYRWSIRAITFTGILLVTLTNVICWFASDIYVITFFLGGLQGLGVGMAVTLVPVIINQYFSKYKSTGAGIACAGATAGSFALPPIVEFAIEEYGLKGAFLMMAGITLHGVLGAALMRPAAWLIKNRSSTARAVKENSDLKNKGDQNLNFLKSHSAEKLELEEARSLLKTSQNLSTSVSKPVKNVRFACMDDKQNDNDDEGSSLLTNPAHVSIVSSNVTSNESLPDSSPHSVSESETKNIEISDESRVMVADICYDHVMEPLPTQSASDLQGISQADEDISSHYGKLQLMDNEEDYDPQINLKPNHIPSSSQENDAHNLRSSSSLLSHVNANMQSPSIDVHSSKKWLRSIMEPVKAACQILKHPMFLIIASNYSVFFLSYMTYLIVIVDYSLDLGVDRTDSVFLVSTFSIADLCGRLGSGWITDSGIVQRKHLMMGNMVTVGGLLIATSFTTTYFSVTAVSVSTGLIVGINLILFYALLEEYLGLRELPMAVGLMNFSIGVISLITPVLTGYFRDTMGSYDHLFHFLGALSIFCGLLWVLEPVCATCSGKKLSRSKQLPC